MKRQSDSARRFVAEFELAVTPHDAAVIQNRLEASRMAYNALLTEALKRLDLYQQSRAYQRALRIPKKTEAQRQARQAAFKAARDAWNWSEVGLTVHLRRFGQQFTRTWLNYHVDSQIVNKLAERVALAIVAHSTGKKGRPRLKRRGTMDSLEGINNRQSIMLKTDEDGSLYILWGAGRGAPRLEIPLVIEPFDPYHRHAMACLQPLVGMQGLKFTRVVRRVIRGRDRFFAQLVLVGKPYQRDQLQRIGVVGLDIGPSTIAIVGEGTVQFRRFCDELSSKDRVLRILRRRVDRQRRANNPGCFDEKGRWIKGCRADNFSRRMSRSLCQLATVQQQQAAHRKSLHGHLVRELLTIGSDFRMEKLSYFAFQRSFGRSTIARAPGMFVTQLRRKAAEIGATVTEFSPYHTRLSQTCHGCGTVKKKSLSQRVHRCSCGVVAHRDLYSAYLARFVAENHVDLMQAALEWPRFKDLVTA